MTRSSHSPRSARSNRVPRIALVLSGGNALGAYQAGAYESLHASGRWPQRLAGTSIGAVNAAIIAGNRPEERMPKLRAFWEAAAGPDPVLPMPERGQGRRLYNFLNAANTFMFGRSNLFTVRPPDPLPLLTNCSGQIGRYDVRPLWATLDRVVDFGRLNSGEIRLTLNATDITTGEEVVFDSACEAIGPRHILASAATPFDFPPIEIDGRWLCDGAMSANMAVEALLREPPQNDTVCLAVDLFDPMAARPDSLDAALERRHDLPFANQSRRTEQTLAREYRLRDVIRELSQWLPAEARADKEVQKMIAEGSGAAILLVHLAYRGRPDEVASKIYDYSRLSLRDRWAAGERDMTRGLRAVSEALAVPRRPGLRLLEVPREDAG